MAHWIYSLHPDFGRSGVFLARGVALGLGAAVPIGPVNVQIARRALRGRFLAGAALGCGAVTADVTYAALSSLSFARLLNRPGVVNLIACAGAVLLAWLGVACLGAALKALRSDPIAADDGISSASHADPLHSSYVTGLLMTLLNPMTLAFWFTVVPAATAVAGSVASTAPASCQLTKLTQEATSYLPITCAGVFIGTLAWVCVFSGLLALAGRRKRNGWLAAADAVGGVTLLSFAAVMVWRLIRPHV